ncbi:TPA: hypothetical protein ACIBQR_002729 [Salmonella enterica subsp. enterica serovar Chester]
MMKCWAELSLLKLLDMRLYPQQEKALNNDLVSAVQYFLMRGRLYAEMQMTLARLHQANQYVWQLLGQSSVGTGDGGGWKV